MLSREINALASFLGYIKEILYEKLDKFVIIYLKNILIYIDKKSYIDSI